MFGKVGVRAVSVGVLVTAMLAAVPSVAARAASSSGPQRGGTLTMISPEPPSLDPGQFSTVIAGKIAENVYDMLVMEDPKTGVNHGVLLKSITASPDALTWTLTLRPNVKFTDGTALDSSAIKANFDYALVPANKHSGLSTAAQVASWDVSNPLVAKATLKAPNATWDAQIQRFMDFMASPTALAKYGSSYGSSPDKTVGAGPFTVESWTRGNQITFVRNPNYWDAPKPYLDKVVVLTGIKDEQQQYNTVVTGGADEMTPASVTTYRLGLSASNIQPYTWKYTGDTGRGYFRFNLTRPPFNDPLARQAMVIAADPKKLSAALGGPVATNMYSTKNKWFSANGALPKYNPTKAQDLINQWSAKNGGKPLEFTILGVTGSPLSGASDGQALQALLSGYKNLVVHVAAIQTSQSASIGTSGNFDLYPTFLTGSDPGGFVNNALMTNGSTNYGKYSSAAMDTALAQEIGSTVFKQRKKAYDSVQKMVSDDLPWWVVPVQQFPLDKVLINKDAHLQGYQGSGSPVEIYTANVWIKK